MIYLRFNNSQNPQFGCAVLLLSLTEVFGCVPPSRMCQFVKLYLLLLEPLHAMLDHFRYCAHHPAGLVIFAQLAQLCLFIILIFPIIPIVGTCNIAQTVSDSNHHLVKWFFGISGRLSWVFIRLCNFLLLSNCCLCSLKSLSCPSGLSLNIIVDPFVFLFTASEVHFLMFLWQQLLFGSQDAQCPKGLDSFCLQAALALIRMMTSSCGTHCSFAVIASRLWRKVLFWSIDCCSLCWLCRWARCWMLQDLDSLEASCVFYVKVGKLNHLEHSQIWLVTLNKAAIVRLTIQHDMIVSVSVMYYPRDFLKQTSADIHFLEESPIYMKQLCAFGSRTPQCLPDNKLTTSDWGIVSRGTVGNPCKLQPYAAAINLSITYDLAATYAILTCS